MQVQRKSALSVSENLMKSCQMVAQEAEAPGRGGARGGGRPSNVLQDNFSDSSIFGVKIAGGGTADLGNYNVYEHRILQSCNLNCIFPRSVRH